MAVGVASAVTGRKVRHDVAMTGEITVHGKVMPIGGLKQKVLAAHRAGIKHILFPADNEGELEDIPQDVREQMKLEPISHVDQALALALVPPISALRIASVAPAGTAPRAVERAPEPAHL
jgi:ATP-dependent Lon protease